MGCAVMPLVTPWPLLAGAIITTAAGFAGGYVLADRMGEARVAKTDARRIECEQGRESDRRAAAEKTAHLLARAQEAEATAAARLAARKAAFDKRLKEVRSEIHGLSDGRECLSGDLRLRLNAALGHAADLPQGAGPAAPAHAAAAANPILTEGATDADLARWAIDAASLYEACRARLDAIRQWDEVTHGR